MLKDFHIGESLEYISVEYAKSGRSTCKQCKEKIGANQLRVGILVDDDHFSTGQGTQWFHKECFHFKPRHKNLEVNTLNKKIHNLEALEKKDQKGIIAYLKTQLESIKEGKSKRRAASKSKNKSTQKSEKSESKGRDKSESKPKSEKNNKEKPNAGKQKIQAVSKPKENAVSKPKSKADQSRPKSNVGKPKSKAKYQEKKELPKPQATRKGLRSRSAVQEKTDKVPEIQNKPKKMIKNIKKQKQEAPKKFVSEAQKKVYKEFVEDFNQMTITELKEILGKNNQPKTGTKPELVAKCADGKQFGRIPMCSKCGGGKLRFNRENGKYSCPGYMEDTDFVNCNAKFEFDEVKRLEWNN